MRYKVLFLCTGNSCQSILAEAILKHIGGRQFAAFSAGANPEGEVDPKVLEVLRSEGIATDTLSSKPVGIFREESIDCVITLCDEAAAACPVFSSAKVQVHWGLDDPKLTGRYKEAYDKLHRALQGLVRLGGEDINAEQLNALKP